MTAMHKTKWFVPLFSVGIGLCFLVAFWAGGNAAGGVGALVAMTVIGVVFLVGGRSDLIRGLRGDGRDEYWQRLDVHATALAGHVVIAVILGMCVWEWAHGRDGRPFVQLGTVAGLSYIVSFAVLRWRG